MRRLVLVALLVLVAAALRAQNRAADDFSRTLILISFDGWRWDYDTKAPAPNLRSLMARGVRAENLIPAFPSKTFPNHYTIVTGLYPGHHGIVANSIKDPATGRIFTTSKTQEVRDPMWWGGEPIWVTAARARQPSATMFWPGSEAPIRGVLPRYWTPYDGGYPAEARVDRVLEWLDLPERDRPRFITVYFEDTDRAGHEQGPDSQAVREAVMRADGYLGRLLRGLERRGLEERVNIVVVSDHGMAAVNNERVVVVDDHVSLGDVEIVDINPTLAVYPKPGKEDAVFRALEKAHSRLKVYKRDATPERWHYRDHTRIPPIIGVADEGWQVLRRNAVVALRTRRMGEARGQHGYDPALMSMRALFVAAGPAFKRGVTVPAFENVHIYNALARVLDVTPAANDGSAPVAQRLLR
ncbi:MAG TPA: ectonucleotide pyrophosphatase/phosphodiesterase [Vicinamibacterales bacterium]